MFVFFTPYTYIFGLLYMFFLFSLFSLSNFYAFWLVMEMMTLLLMGISYTVFTNRVSQLMVYFLIQSLSSFLILVSYLVGSPLMLTVAFILKLGMFPFLSWYLNSVRRFPNFIFWLTGTLHKLPPLLMLLQFNLVLDTALFWGSVLLTTFIAGIIMLITSDFRYLLVSSSVGNNSWFLLSEQVNYSVFLLFIGVYSLFLFFLISSFGELTKPGLSLNYQSDSGSVKWWFFLLCVSGLPPFPLFFAKMLVIYNLFLLGSLNYLFIAFLLFNCFMVAGYLNYMMGRIVRRYTSPLHFYL